MQRNLQLGATNTDGLEDGPAGTSPPGALGYIWDNNCRHDL